MRRSSNYTKKVTCDTWVTRESIYSGVTQEPPPKPSINQTTNSEGAHALRCTADTKDLGPVNYEWKEHELKEDKWEEGPWTEGEALKGMNSSDTPEKFSCRLKTLLRTGEASDPFLNPTEPPPKPSLNQTTNSEGAHALRCTADTKGLVPVFYEWKKYEFMISEWKEGNWTKGDQLMVMSPKTCDKFSCRLISGRPSEAGDPFLNPLCEPPEPPPKPSLMTTKNSAGVYTLKCTADTQGLVPVTYEWKEYGRKEGNWTKGDQLMVMRSKTCDKFSCRLITLLRTSEASDPVLNPLCESGPIWWKVLLGITVLLFAVCAALISVVYKCPEHPFSIRLKKWIPFYKKPVRPADPVCVSLTAVPVKTAIQVEPANTLQQANGVAASNGGIADQPNAAAEPLLSSKSVAGDSELGK
ncbi:unnamed protein product [Boreogadus saida]